MIEPQIAIHPILSRLKRPLAQDEREHLVDSILSIGRIICPLVVWKEGRFLLDGHQRLWIARQHGVPYDVKRISFPNELEAACWTARQALGQRRMSDQADEAVAEFLRRCLDRRILEFQEIGEPS